MIGAVTQRFSLLLSDSKYNEEMTMMKLISEATSQSNQLSRTIFRPILITYS